MRAFRLLSFLLLLTSCSSPTEKNKFAVDSVAALTKNSTETIIADEEKDDSEFIDSLTCEDLNNKEIIFEQAKNAQNQETGYMDIDTTVAPQIFRNHFVSKDEISTVILVQESSAAYLLGQPYLLMLYECGKEVRLLHVENNMGFSENDIRDLDGDGVMEITSTGDFLNMGECSTNFEIFNFKGGEKNELFKSNGYSLVECGGDHDSDFKKGDTLGREMKNELVKSENPLVYKVKVVRSYKICNGGKTSVEILKRAILVTDSILVPLQKLNH